MQGVFEEIIVGVTPDRRSRAAVRRGLELAGRLGAHVRWIHAVELPGARDEASSKDAARAHPEVLVEARKQVLDALRRPAEALGIAPDALDEDLHVEPGPPARVLLDSARDLGADALLIGPHASPGLDFGTTARALFAASPVPVWLQGSPAEAIRSIVAALDLSPASKLVASTAAGLARGLGARLDLLHVLEAPGSDPEARTRARAELEARAEESGGHGSDVGVQVVSGEVVEALLQETRDHDLIVLGTHGRTGLARFLLGSVAYGLLRYARRPVLAVPTERGDWLLPA